MDTAHGGASPIAVPSPDVALHDKVTGRERFAGLDGLRGVAAIIVVVAHSLDVLALPRPDHFFLAVDFFFILSGFVVAHAYDQRLSTRSLDLSLFVRMRLVRLHPLLALSIVIALLGRVVQSMLQTGDVPIGELLIATLCGLLCIPFHTLRDDPSAFTLNSPEWSLLAEYVVNFAYGLVAPWLSQARLIAVVAAGALMTFATVAIEGTLNVGWQLSDWKLSLVRVVFPFFLGVSIARLHRSGMLPDFRAPWPLLAVGLAVLLVMPRMSHDALVQLVVVMLAFPLIILAGRSERPQTKLRIIMVWFGAISYPIYILHYPLVRGVARLVPPQLEPSAVLVLQIAVVLVCASAGLKIETWVRTALDPRRPR